MTDARQFLADTHSAVLSTHSASNPGYPFGSVAPYVIDHTGAPLILISTIAEHTKNIIANPKVSLMVFAGADDLHANARLTLLGDAALVEKTDPALKSRYLRYFPQAESYFDMHDFNFYRIEIQRARYIGGFGKIAWLERDTLTMPENTLAEQESGILEHMNADHANNLASYCQHVHQITAEQLEMIGIDSVGFDIRADEKILRFQFETPITDALGARKALVALAKASRQA